MGRKASQARRETRRNIRREPLSDAERDKLEQATYEASPYHKGCPGDFGLTPPALARADKTLCDEANITTKAQALALFARAKEQQIVSEFTHCGFPKQMWVVDEEGDWVYEAMYGGSVEGAYHGYPVRRTDPLYDQVKRALRNP